VRPLVQGLQHGHDPPGRSHCFEQVPCFSVVSTQSRKDIHEALRSSTSKEHLCSNTSSEKSNRAPWGGNDRFHPCRRPLDLKQSDYGLDTVIIHLCLFLPNLMFMTSAPQCLPKRTSCGMREEDWIQLGNSSFPPSPAPFGPRRVDNVGPRPWKAQDRLNRCRKKIIKRPSL